MGNRKRQEEQAGWPGGRTTKRNLGGLGRVKLDRRANDPHMVLLKSEQPRFKKILKIRRAMLALQYGGEMQWK